MQRAWVCLPKPSSTTSATAQTIPVHAATHPAPCACPILPGLPGLTGLDCIPSSELGAENTPFKTNIVLLNLFRFHCGWHCNHNIQWQMNSCARGVDAAPKADLYLPLIL